MTVSLCLTAYDRPGLLQIALENLLVTHPSGADHVFIAVDFHSPAVTKEVLGVIETYVKRLGTLTYTPPGDETRGVADTTNFSLHVGSLRSDVLIHMDSDCYITQPGWAKKVEEFLQFHPEVGIVAPDLPGRYMRIKRDGYDEIEYCLGMVFGLRKKVYESVRYFHATGFFDCDIHHQFDPDVCLRARMKGFRVGVIPLGNFVDQGVGSGDSSRSASVWKGGFEFLRKWNLHHLGFFNYKSPLSLLWPQFPINVLWRKLWLSQFGFNEDIKPETIQGHSFDLVKWPAELGKWGLETDRKCLASNVWFHGIDTYEKVSPDLLSGKRKWSLEDMQ